MGFSLKKWFEEAWAQAVPGDSKTAATVRASRQQAQPAVTTRKQTPRANIKPFKNPQIERAARNLRAGKMTPDAFANYVTSMGPSKDWRDSTSTGNKFVDGSINVAKGIGNTGTQVAKGLVNPDTYVGGVKRFNQAIASTILKPVSDRHADQERERAERLLIPSYENMYRAYGADPRLGKNQAQIEANMADYNLRTDPLRRNNINVNDSTGTVTRKVGAKGAEAFLDIVTAPMGGAALKAGAKGMVRPVLANTFKAGLTGSGNALAYAAQQDGMSGVDYIKAGSQGFAMGSAMPLVMGAAGRAMGGAVERLPRSTGKVYPYTNYKINETSSGKLKLSKDLPQTIETAKTALLNGKEAIKRLNADLGQGGYVKNPFYKDNPVTEAFDTLPPDIHPSIEAKAVGAKRIAPDRVPHQQLAVRDGIEKLVEAEKAVASKRSEGWIKIATDVDALIKKYGDTMPARTKGNLEKFPDLQKDFSTYAYLKKNTYGRVDGLDGMKEQFLNNSQRVGWNPTRESAVRAGVDKKYRDLVAKDISKGYRYPEEVLNYDKSFRTAVDSRARYEKGFATSFSADDARIVFDEQNRVPVGLKRQDGKELTLAQKEEIIQGVVQTQRLLGIDINKLAKDERWIFAHLNGKNPFLTKGAAGQYRNHGNSASISLGGTESFIVRENGKNVTKKVNTTAAHEIGHALDLRLKGGLLDYRTLSDLKYSFKPTDGLGRSNKYWRKDTEVTARAIEQYAAVKEGSTAFYDREGYWTKEIFDSKIKPAIEKAIDDKYSDYKLIQAQTQVQAAPTQKTPQPQPAPKVEAPKSAPIEKTPQPKPATVEKASKLEPKDIKTRTIKTADGKTEYVAQLGNTVRDRVGRENGFEATLTSPNFKTEGELNKWIRNNTDPGIKQKEARIRDIQSKFAETGKITGKEWNENNKLGTELRQMYDAPPAPKPTLQDALEGKSTKVKELPNKPSGRMSKAEKESLYASAPPGTERTLKVQQPNNGSNVPVSKVTQQGDVVTKTNVNPNIKKGEKRFSLDDKGDLIPDQNGAYRLFTDDDGKVTGFRVGDKYYSAKDFGDLSDVNDYGSALATQRRNVERAFGKETGEKVNQFLVDHQQAQATKMIERQLEFSKGLDSLKKELGISFKIGRHRAKKVSAAIQDYGEGKIRKPELIEQFGKDQADKIVKADKWFRNQYDTLLDEMNDTLVKYGYDPVPKRKNYYTHFQEPSLWQSFGLKMQELKNMSSPTMQDALPDAPRGSISNKLAGQSEYLQPNKKFNQFALQRKGDLHKADAFGAFERYLNPTLNNIYMTPSITRARVISRAIAQEADLAGKDANGILIQTREWANSLAGKSNRWGDRQLSDSKFGRKYLKATQWAQKMAGQNTIVGNLSTAVMQPIVLQQTVGKFGIKNTILGLMQEMGPAHSKNAPIRKSPFMNRRYSKFESATAGKIDAARGIANKPLEVVEETAARVTWNAAHNDALSQGLTGSKAIRYADINAEKTLAGRAIGEKPEMFRSKTAAPLTMYQLEVNNFWQQFGKEMTKTQAAKTMVAAYGLNLVLQEITGRQVGFNPVDAAIDSYQETQKEDKTTGQKAITIAQRAAGEVVDNTPFVGPVMNTIVGDKGVKGMTGNDSNTGKFGVGSPLSALTNTTKVEVGDKEIPVPLNAILPFGGAQVKKTYEGWKALQDGGLDDKNDKRLVDIPQSAENTAKGLVFGKGAIPEVNQYYENIGKKKADQKPVQNQTNSRASKMGPAGSGNDPKDIYAAAFNSKEGQAMLALGTDKEREEQYPELFKDYKAMKTAFEYDRTKYRPDNYDKLSNDSKAIYDKLGSLTDEAQDKWLKRTASGSSEKVYNSLNAIKPKDYPGLPKTNEVAKMYADFESDQKENNWTGTRLESEKKKLVRSAYETILNDNEKYILSANTDDTLAMVENGEVDKDTMDKLVQYDDMMIALGGSARISKTVRGKLGYSAATTKSYSSGSRSGSSTKIAKGKYSLADLLSSVQSTNKTLRQLLEQTLKG